MRSENAADYHPGPVTPHYGTTNARHRNTHDFVQRRFRQLVDQRRRRQNRRRVDRRVRWRRFGFRSLGLGVSVRQLIRRVRGGRGVVQERIPAPVRRRERIGTTDGVELSGERILGTLENDFRRQKRIGQVLADDAGRIEMIKLGDRILWSVRKDRLLLDSESVGGRRKVRHRNRNVRRHPDARVHRRRVGRVARIGRRSRRRRRWLDLRQLWDGRQLEVDEFCRIGGRRTQVAAADVAVRGPAVEGGVERQSQLVTSLLILWTKRKEKTKI